VKFDELKTIYVVPYSHIDWQWRNNRRYFIHRNRQVIFAAIDFLESKRKYRWSGIERSHVIEDFWNTYPSLREPLAHAVREGRCDLGGSTHGTPLSAWVEEELFFRNLLYGKRFYERLFGKTRDPVLYFADVPVAFAQVPQIAKKFGFEYFIIDRPSEALGLKGIPRQFRWQGPEGSELLVDRTMYGRTFPGTSGNHVSCSPGIFPALAERTKKLLVYFLHDAVAPAVYLPDSNDWSFPTLNLPEFTEWWNATIKSPAMTIATHTEYFDALAQWRKKLPVFSGNLDPIGWNGCYGGNGEKPNLRLRKTHNLILLAERIAALSKIIRGSEYPEKYFEEIFSRLCVIYCHGAYSTAMVFPEDYKAIEKELDEMRSGLMSIISGIESPPAKAAEPAIFNPLPWERTEWIELNSKRRLVRAKPICWTTLSETQQKFKPVTVGEAQVENEYLLVSFGKGGIAQITDKTHNRLILTEGPGSVAVDSGQINLLTANFTATKQIAFGPAVIKAEDWRAQATQDGRIGENRVRLITELRAGERLLRARIRIESHEVNLRYRFCLPLRGNSTWRLFADDICAMTERDLSAEPLVGLTRSNPAELCESPLETPPAPAYGSNEGVFYAVNAAVAHDGAYGVGLVNSGNVGYVWKDNVLSNILLRTVPADKLDQYTPATYLTGLGEYEFDLAIYPEQSAGLSPFLKMGRNYNQPLHVANGVADERLTTPLVTCDAENIIISAAHFDRGDLIVRAYELEGRDTECRFVFGFNPAGASETDFRGQETDAATLGGQSLTTVFRAREIKQLRIKTRNGNEKKQEMVPCRN